MSVVPNFIIAGVNKAGTTSLFAYLASHPEVSGSRIKETCYFLPIRYGGSPGRFEDYLSLFDQNSLLPIVMEATPGYFYGGEPLAKEIDSTLPNVKIAVVLRDPASRLLSFFNFMKSMILIDQSMTFNDYVRRCQKLTPSELQIQANNPYFGVEGGFYSKYLGFWRQRYGDRLKVLSFEDLRDNPRGCMVELCEWLNIETGFYETFDFLVENKTSQFRSKRAQQAAIFINKRFEGIFRRYPQLKNGLRNIYARLNLSGKQSYVDEDDRALARSLYRESNLELKTMLQDDFDVSIPPWLRDL